MFTASLITCLRARDPCLELASGRSQKRAVLPPGGWLEGGGGSRMFWCPSASNLADRDLARLEAAQPSCGHSARHHRDRLSRRSPRRGPRAHRRPPVDDLNLSAQVGQLPADTSARAAASVGLVSVAFVAAYRDACGLAFSCARCRVACSGLSRRRRRLHRPHRGNRRNRG